MPAPTAVDRMENDAAIRAIDDLLASVGIEHGSRATLKSGAKAQRQPSKDIQAKRRAGPRAKTRAGIAPLIIAAWQQKYPWLLHGFSTRTGGISAIYQPGSRLRDLNLGFTAADDRTNVTENRQRFLAAVAGASQSKKISLVTLHQIHSSLIREVTAATIPSTQKATQRGDGLLTREPGLLLGILTADCIPILVADTRQRIVAAFHAGWRGTLARIVESGVGRMRAEFGSRPADLTAAIGPGIGQCCYAVSEELRFDFESQFAYAPTLFREVYDSDSIREKYPLLFMTARAPGHSNLGPSLHLDLPAANHRQLLDAGVPAKAIHRFDDNNACTACHPAQFFSHRAQQGFTGRMMSVIGVTR